MLTIRKGCMTLDQGLSNKSFMVNA